MRNRNILLLLIALCIIGCEHKTDTSLTDLKKFELKGKIRAFRTNEFSRFGETHYVFNESGNISQLSWINSGKLLRKELYYYHSNILDSIVRFHHNDSLQSKTLFSYKNNQLIKSQFFNGNNGLERNWKYEYNENGLLQKEVLYYEPNTVISTKISEYDVLNRLKTLKELEKSETTFEYNSNGQVIKKTITYFDDGALSTYKYDYDENGFLIREIDVENNIVTNWIYDVDNHGNWKSKKSLVNFQDPIEVAKREIEYYE